jgi:BASS family bile acid:Na+ symporter
MMSGTAMSYRAAVGVATPLITFILLAAVGLAMEAREFRRVLARPRLLVLGLLVPPVVLPALALGLITLASPPPAIASGLLLVAICPVGGISTTFTYLARGATALSLVLTGASCLLAFASVPSLATVVAPFAVLPPLGPLPAGVLLVQLLVAVVLPVSLGMAVRRVRPDLAASWEPGLRKAAFGLLALLLAMIVLADVPAFLAALPTAVPLAAAFIAVSVLVGGGVAHVLGVGRRDRVALAIEFATRNVAVANMLALSGGQLGFATFATTYFLTELPVMAAAVGMFRWIAGHGSAPSAADVPNRTRAGFP